LIVRYVADKNGKQKKIALIYTKKEHLFKRWKIDENALTICDRLNYAGYKAYIVGGAVRDILVDKNPKDFDIVTDAYPQTIKRIFRNSRIIGKRFKLVHVYIGNNIYEVSTFRAAAGKVLEKVRDIKNNNYGTMAEDVWRRDFTINALYFDPRGEEIIDFTGGYKDLKKRVVKNVVPLKIIFTEDPIRIIRAIKYSVLINGRISFGLKMRIKKDIKELVSCSFSRLTEEVLKFMKTGCSAKIFKKLSSFGIIKLILPNIYIAQKSFAFYKRLEAFDNTREKKFSDNISVFLKPLLEDFVIAYAGSNNKAMLQKMGIDTEPGIKTLREVISAVKIFLRPITPPNIDIADAIKAITKQNNIKLKNTSFIREQDKDNIKQANSNLKNISLPKS
jgi:poly(A) polymerase